MTMLTGSSIVKVVWEATIVIEAVVRILGGRQGSAQGEKQNSLLTMIRMETHDKDYIDGQLSESKSGFNAQEWNFCDRWIWMKKRPVAWQVMAGTGSLG